MAELGVSDVGDGEQSPSSALALEGSAVSHAVQCLHPMDRNVDLVRWWWFSSVKSIQCSRGALLWCTPCSTLTGSITRVWPPALLRPVAFVSL